jgi:hypothetical protein
LPEEGLSDENGEVFFKFRDVGVHYIRAEKQGYFPIVKKINLTQAFIESGDVISLPMIPNDLDDDEAIVLLSADCDVKNMKLQTVSQKKKEGHDGESLKYNAQVIKLDLKDMY